MDWLITCSWYYLFKSVRSRKIRTLTMLVVQVASETRTAGQA
jgi:hypothetical protein